jgi:hypothetical protein
MNPATNDLDDDKKQIYEVWGRYIYLFKKKIYENSKFNEVFWQFWLNSYEPCHIWCGW